MSSSRKFAWRLRRFTGLFLGLTGVGLLLAVLMHAQRMVRDDTAIELDGKPASTDDRAHPDFKKWGATDLHCRFVKMNGRPVLIEDTGGRCFASW